MDNVNIGAVDYTFTGVVESLATLPDAPDWTVVILPDSVELFGTGRAVKIVGTVDGAPVRTAFMPTGHGGHFLPMSAAVRKRIGKGVGDRVTVHLEQRLS